ncbi:AI-2E family transporter [Paraliomyxa miuraensis]|uniref:AI-2E family transporter n=1 Tax=Paraliomyxa miuraensis TaxID=376150 RepID=UPI00224D6E0B|nr:AI-2E family transporter [Paraliomyxa miuraensis]MCX4245701.1 AI-2E family transporter [Paraliomyxa miuraensis]
MSEQEQPQAAGSRSGIRKRPDTILGVLRRFGRLWGFLLFAIAVVVLFRGIVLPFVFGFLVAYLLAPIIARIERWTGRALGIVVVYLGIVGITAAFVGFLVPAVVHDLAKLRDGLPAAAAEINDKWLPQASEWVDSTFSEWTKPKDEPEPNYSTEIKAEPGRDGSWQLDLKDVRLHVEQRTDGTWVIGAPQPEPDAPDLGESLRELLSSQGTELTTEVALVVRSVVTGVFGFLTSFVITFMIAAFVLIDVDRVNRFVRSLVPMEYRGEFEELWASMNKGLGGVVRGQLLICLVNGALTFLGLVIFGIKYSFLLALLAGMFSLIPIFGTIISSIPIVVIALVSSGEELSFGPAIGMLAWISGIHLLEANVLNPKIIGDSAHMHPVIVIFALLAGEHVYGLTGALLAIPAASLVQAAFIHARRHSIEFARDPESLE